MQSAESITLEEAERLQLCVVNRLLDVIYGNVRASGRLEMPADEGTRCRECGSPEAGGCYYCKAD